MMIGVILAAGMGTRLMPLTKDIPKALLKINDMTLLERMIKNFVDVDIKSFIVIVGYNRDKVIDLCPIIGEKYGVQIEEIERDYCRPTDFNGEAYKLVEQVLNENFPDVIVAPFLLTAGTDARRFTDVADNILRFAPIDLSKSQFATIHGADENIGIKNVGECVMFYKTFIKKYS